MTREELIEVICASDNSSFCHNICRTEEGFSCEVCAENQLEEYEKQIRNKTIDDCIETLYDVTPNTLDQKLDMVFVDALRQLKEE